MAAAMTLNGTPNDLIQNLNPISIVILIPIFDYIIYPFLRRNGIKLQPRQARCDWLRVRWPFNGLRRCSSALHL